MNPFAADLLFTIYGYADRGLIFFYRLFDYPMAGYLFGTAVLALVCAAAGRLTLSVSEKMNQKHLAADNREMVRMHNLSLKALAARDKAAYTACNREANTAFGRCFFGRAALGMASLWPVPFALAWMDARFSAVNFALPLHLPGFGDSVGYTFTFIPIYILARILVARLLPRDRTRESDVMEILTFSDLFEKGSQPEG